MMISDRNRRILKINKEQKYVLEWQASCKTKSVLIAFLYVCDAIAQKYSTKAFKFHNSSFSKELNIGNALFNGDGLLQVTLPSDTPFVYIAGGDQKFYLNDSEQLVKIVYIPKAGTMPLQYKEVHEFVTFNIEDLPQAKVKGIDVAHKIPSPQGDAYLAQEATLGSADKKSSGFLSLGGGGDDGDFKKVHGKDGKSQMKFFELSKKHTQVDNPDDQFYSAEEVMQHNREDDCWTVYQGKIYDVTQYLDYHPGGKAKLMLGAGNNCEPFVLKYHPWVNIHYIARRFQVGVLKN